jgi:hypothetical protein
MSTTPVRAALLAALACAAAAPAAATAQTTRERLRVEKERADREQAERERRDRLAREREDRERDDRDRAERRRYEEEQLARERDRDRERERERERDRALALDRAREARERTLRLERERVARERDARERAYQVERARRLTEERRTTELRRTLDREREVRLREQRARDLRRRYRDEWRPRVSLSGGMDIREFDGADDRYLVQGGVDFRTRSGLGMRPEVTYAWTDRGGTQVAVGAGGTPVGTIAVGRTQALGVMLNATYTFFRTSMVRPYVLGGPGVLSTRIAPVRAADIVIQPGTPTTLPSTAARHEFDVGLNAGAGLEMALGPVRLFTETRYFLTDSPVARGFSGMVPITAGIRF